MDWLDSVNGRRRGTPLDCCHLATDKDIFRMPWEDAVHPEFINRPKRVKHPAEVKKVKAEGAAPNRAQESQPSDSNSGLLNCSCGLMNNAAQQGGGCHNQGIRVPVQGQSCGDNSLDDSDLEGEYVELADISLPRFSPQKGSLTQSISLNYRNKNKARTNSCTQNNNANASCKSNTCSQTTVCMKLIDNFEDSYHPVILSPTSSLDESETAESNDSKLSHLEGTPSDIATSMPKVESVLELPEAEVTDLHNLLHSTRCQCTDGSTVLSELANEVLRYERSPVAAKQGRESLAVEEKDVKGQSGKLLSRAEVAGSCSDVGSDVYREGQPEHADANHLTGGSLRKGSKAEHRARSDCVPTSTPHQSSLDTSFLSSTPHQGSPCNLHPSPTLQQDIPNYVHASYTPHQDTPKTVRPSGTPHQSTPDSLHPSPTRHLNSPSTLQQNIPKMSPSLSHSDISNFSPTLPILHCNPPDDSSPSSFLQHQKTADAPSLYPSSSPTSNVLILFSTLQQFCANTSLPIPNLSQNCTSVSPLSPTMYHNTPEDLSASPVPCQNETTIFSLPQHNHNNCIPISVALHQNPPDISASSPTVHQSTIEPISPDFTVLCPATDKSLPNQNIPDNTVLISLPTEALLEKDNSFLSFDDLLFSGAEEGGTMIQLGTPKFVSVFTELGEGLVDEQGKSLVDVEGEGLVDEEGVADEQLDGLVDEKPESLVEVYSEGLMDNQEDNLVDGQGLVDAQGQSLVYEQGEGIVDEHREGLVDKQWQGMLDEQGEGLLSVASMRVSNGRDQRSVKCKVKESRETSVHVGVMAKRVEEPHKCLSKTVPLPVRIAPAAPLAESSSAGAVAKAEAVPGCGQKKKEEEKEEGSQLQGGTLIEEDSESALPIAWEMEGAEKSKEAINNNAPGDKAGLSHGPALVGEAEVALNSLHTQHTQMSPSQPCDSHAAPTMTVGERRQENGGMGEEWMQRVEEKRSEPRILQSSVGILQGKHMDSHPQGLDQGEWEAPAAGLLSVSQGQQARAAGTDDGDVREGQQNSHCLRQASSKTEPSLTESPNVNTEVLGSGVLSLPGTRDKCGRALVTVTSRNTIWLNPSCNTSELVRILVYFYTILRKEVRSLGLTILVDARRCSPVPALFKAFSNVQNAMPECIHTILLLADRDLTFHMEKPSSLQFELLTSLKSLHKHVDISQLPTEFDGTFPFSHGSWINFRMRVEQLTRSCQDAVSLLKGTISSLETTPLPSTAEEAHVLLCQYRTLMCSVLEDSRLVRLQLQGGATLSRLRKEESSISLTEDYRDAIETVSQLYNQVDELVHNLVMLSNRCTQELEFIMEFKTLEEGFTEVRGWIEEVGERRLKTLSELEDSLEQLHQKQAHFRDFYSAAYEHCKSGEALLKRLERWEDVSSAQLQVYEVKVRSFWVHLRDFSQRVEDTKDKIDKTIKLYEFFDKAYEWALEGMRHLACISIEDCSTPERCQAIIKCLESYRRQYPGIPDTRFQEMKELAGELKSEKGLMQWKFAWSKCQETKQMFEKKLETALRNRHSVPSDLLEEGRDSRAPGHHPEASDSRRCSSVSSSCRRVFSVNLGRERLPENPMTHIPEPADFKSSTANFFSPDCRVSHTSSSQRLTRSTSTEEPPHRARLEAQSRPAPSSYSPRSSLCSYSPRSSLCSYSPRSSVAEPGRRVLRKTQSFDAPMDSARYGSCHRTPSEPSRRGHTGVFIKGLEVSSTEVVERSPRLPPQGWATSDVLQHSTPIPETKAKGSKLRHIVDEMVTTEREYVRSLRYIINHYFPEMERPDLPQDLRGKRSVIFGNLEKLVDFHSQYFLKELESCCNHPLRVSHCFLRHQDQFGLYALYSKNKPKSDALLTSNGNTFFRNKQLELEDKMDLASYLLKPIQRMSKYALLLKDLIKEVSEVQEQELSYLSAAAEMVKFQLRHGNDLLAMDAIRDCDVNLKEQGQLVRQDEFTIWYGRKKCQRHVFLLEDLVLFSKPKKIEGGLDVYIYKHSFKTADVGMTETSGESGLRFEIWFRRRTSKNQTYVLQAGSTEIKQAWTSDIARILWQQATRNKEIRMQEMVSMGVGNKPFLDIKPSDAAINDRAIDYIMKGRGARTRASIAVSLFDHSNPFKRAPVSGPLLTGGPPSSSLLGPLNLHMYSNQALLPREQPFVSPCIEEDELEHETSSQPSMTTESSESSSHCMSGNGSSGSDSGCVSSHLPEVLSEEPSSPCHPPCYSAMASPIQDKPRFNSQYISAV